MSSFRRIVLLVGCVTTVLTTGCTAPKVNFAVMERPARAVELAAFDVFVGSWTFEAKVLNSEDPNDIWTGESTWGWTLDKRCLHGQMCLRGKHTEFKSEGFWSWNPKSKKYLWWMFNNWGYPQEGKATYCDKTKSWRMNYRSIGLDGTKSYGRYLLKVIDNDTIEWQMQEWADALHTILKLEMDGTYRRAK